MNSETLKETEKKSKTVNKSSAKIAKIEPVQKEAIDLSDNASTEASLLESLQIILRINGLERSISSIRDMADVTDGEFGYSDAISALENLEFSANVGQLRPRKISHGHCPAIIELKGGKTAVLTSVDANKDYTLYDENADDKFTKYSEKDFRKIYNGGILLIKNRRQQRDSTKNKKGKLVLGFAYAE